MDISKIVGVISTILGVLTAIIQMYGNQYKTFEEMKNNYYENILKKFYDRYTSKAVKPSKIEIVRLLESNYNILPTYLKDKYDKIDKVNPAFEECNDIIKILSIEYANMTPNLCNILEKNIVLVFNIVINTMFFTVTGYFYYWLCSVGYTYFSKQTFVAITIFSIIQAIINLIMLTIIIVFPIGSITLFYKLIRLLLNWVDTYTLDIKRIGNNYDGLLTQFSKKKDKNFILRQAIRILL